MENPIVQRARRNVSLSFLYQGKEHKFVKAELSEDFTETLKELTQHKDHKRNFFNSPTPLCKLDNNDKF
ncbi:hypothetical protein SteCoe_35197 [Stentor coeruleus]|uniref:Uncharacterized protein n=1 Tax=Stentor coeruleus TaxID=5963 RepID=A0A1R2ASV1_9CILI|nr:hypothetical protein SteCoe_35197 [Stentor coeruleus]